MPDNPKLDRQLAKEFNVPESRIDTLRGQKLGFGEIRHVLSIASQMPRGINDANINKIMEMRENHTGWGRIADTLGVKPGHGNFPVENHRFNSSSAGFSHIGGNMGHGH